MGDDYGTPKPSPRQVVAQDIADLISELELDQPVGGMLGKAETNRFWYVTFSKPVNLDGQVSIFSEEYITVSWTTRFLDMPHEGRMVFDNAELAKLFLRLAFGPNRDASNAMRIPQRVGKREAKRLAKEVEDRKAGLEASAEVASPIPSKFDEDFFLSGGNDQEYQGDE